MKYYKRLYRSNERKMAGICGGIAEYFSIDPVLIRLLWLFFTLLGGCGIFLYIIAWVVIPSKPKHLSQSSKIKEEYSIKK